MLHTTIIWIHLVALIGALGGLFFFSRLLGAGDPGAVAQAGQVSRLGNLCIVVGFLAGLALYYEKVTQALQAGYIIPSRFHALVGTKLLLLLAVGACLGIGSAKVRKGGIAAARILYLSAALLLAAAAFLGTRLHNY